MKNFLIASALMAAALTLGFAGGQAMALESNQDFQLAQTSTTIIERKTEVLPDNGLSRPDLTSETETEVYRSETSVIGDVDNNDVDANDAEIAGLSLTTLLIFAILAFSIVAIVVAMSRRERPVI